MNFSDLDINGVIALVAAAFGLINTILQRRASVEIKEIKTIAVETKVKTEALAEEKMAKLLDDALAVRKSRK